MTWGAVGSAAVGVIGGALTHKSTSGAGNGAAAMAQFKPTDINGLLGNVSATNNYGSLTYNTQANPMTGALASQFGGLAGQLGGGVDMSALQNAANQYGSQSANVGNSLLGQYGQNQGITSALGNNALGAGSQFNGAANGMLAQLGNFNPQQYAQGAYNQMAGLQNAYNTDQTQSMLNYEQQAGRGGLTQNGQLGDLGGIQLAQGLTDNNLRMQAMNMGQQQQQLMGNQANQFASTGMGQSQTAMGNYLNSLTQGANAGQMGAGMYGNAANAQSGLFNTLLGGSGQANTQLLNLNTALMNQAQLSQQASSSQAQANNNAANYSFLSGMANANNTGNMIGGISQGLNNSGAYGAFGNWMQKITGIGGGGSGNSSNYSIPAIGTGDLSNSNAIASGNVDLSGYGSGLSNDLAYGTNDPSGDATNS